MLKYHSVLTELHSNLMSMDLWTFLHAQPRRNPLIVPLGPPFKPNPHHTHTCTLNLLLHNQNPIITHSFKAKSPSFPAALSLTHSNMCTHTHTQAYSRCAGGRVFLHGRQKTVRFLNTFHSSDHTQQLFCRFDPLVFCAFLR